MPLLTSFINYLRHEKRYSEHTVLAYGNDLTQFMELLEIREEEEMLEVNHMMIRTYIAELAELELENSSINR
ncbi:site-specific integrase, partial [Crocinitomix catalasitica]|nr:site-specific integrase [Crocinitomix catalasitica]